jgi:hypothetical protein
MTLTRKKGIYVDFTAQKPTPSFAASGAIITAADAQTDYFRTDNGQYFEFFQDGANTAAVANLHASAVGMLLPGDNAAEAFMMTNGILATQNSQAYTVGTDAAFFLQHVLKVGTIARTTLLQAGFRKQGAYVDIAGADATTALAAHTDKAGIGLVSVAAAIATQTSLNGSDVQTALAKTAPTNDDFMALRVDVSATGVVTYQIGVHTTTVAGALSDLAADASAVAFTFDDAEVLIPYLWRQGTASTGVSDTYLATYEVDYA